RGLGAGGGDVVEAHGLAGVRLEERVGRYLEDVAPEAVVDDAGAEHRHRLLPEGRLRRAAVDGVDEGGGLGELGAEPVGEGGHALGVLAARDEVDHPLLGVRGGADDEVAEVAALPPRVPGLPAVLPGEGADAVDEAPAPVALEVARAEVEHPVEPAGDVEAEGEVAVVRLAGGDLPVRQPAAGGEGELHLVAVEVDAAGAL